VTRDISGEIVVEGSGHEADDLPMGSVVYVGRKSFRMEAVALEPELARELGIVQPIASQSGIVTAPLHAPSRREDDDGVPPLRSLFSSHVSVPLLAAPSGAVGVGNVGSPRVTFTRASLATTGALVLLCGVVVGTAARHLLAPPKPLAVVSAPAPMPAMAAPRALPVPAAPISAVPSVETAPPSPPPAPAAPAPVTIRAHVKAAPSPIRKRPTTIEASTSTDADSASAPKAWVDPWAE
jgi:hypothetical protein